MEEPTNIAAIEKTRNYNGVYHVLHGTLSPLHGVGPDQLRIANLARRVESGSVDELIIATNPTVEGEATATYLSRLLKSSGVRITRIATGVPVGQRHRVRRRGHHAEGHGRAQGTLTLGLQSFRSLRATSRNTR